MTTQEEKRAIRLQVRHQFRQLSAEERLHRSAALYARIEQMPEFPPRSLIPPRSLGGISFRLNSSLFLAWLSRHKEHASGAAKVSTTVFSPSLASCRPTNRAFASPFRYSATSRPSHTTFSWIAWSINSPFPHHVRMLRCFLFGLKPRRDFSGF